MFTNFANLSQEVTWDFYQEALGDALTREQLHDVDELRARQELENESLNAARRFLQDTYRPNRPFTISSSSVGAERAVEFLKKSRLELQTVAAKHHENLDNFREYEVQLVYVAQSSKLLAAGYKLERDSFPIELTNTRQVQQTRDMAEGEMQRLSADLIPVEVLGCRRLGVNLALLDHVQLIGDDSHALDQEAAPLVELFNKITEHKSAIDRVTQSFHGLEVLLGMLDGNPHDELIIMIQSTMENCHTTVMSVLNAFEHDPYPFDHAEGAISVSRFLVRESPPADDPGVLLNSADRISDELPRLQYRVLGRLCQIAEQVESCLGMEPLPIPDAPEETKATE